MTKLHMVGNAHLDPVWFWRWPEGFHEIKATFRSALDRINEHPDFIFTCSAASYYAWIEEQEPEMFEEIRQRVREGRWVLVGGQWVQPDCNTPMGESFARHALISQRFFEKHFGKIAKCGYNVDSFGHNGMLPQILLQSGMTSYTFMRPMRHEKTLPSNILLWKSDDGSTIPAFRIPIAYCTWTPDLKERMEGCKAEMPADAPAAMGFYGVGNHGGGPTKENLASIDALKDEMNMEYSSPERFFDELDTQGLPVVEGELLHHASGCYSVVSEMKRRNRQSEWSLLTAECWAAVAHQQLGRAYPHEKLEDAWKDLLFNQFHDILSGTAAKEAYEDAFNQLGGVCAAAQKVETSATQALAWRINIPLNEALRPFVVFNSLPYPAVRQIEFQTASPANGIVLTDDQGNEVPCQLTWGTGAGGSRRTAMLEAELPAMGYRLFYGRPADSPAELQTFPETYEMENEFLHVTIDPKTGYLTGLRDLQSGREALRGASAVPVVIDDSECDTWAHGVFSFRKLDGAFELRHIQWLENGPVRQVIRAEFAWKNSVIVQRFVLWKHSKQLDIHLDINWQEALRMLKWEVKYAGNAAQTCAETAYGVSSRPTDGIEYPMHSWVQAGHITCLNDSKYAYDALEDTLRVTLLRSPRYAHHEPKQPGADEFYPIIDMGLQVVHLALTAHEMEARAACVAGQMLNVPPVVQQETFHDGPLPAAHSFIEMQGAVMTCCKKAADGSNAWIIRAVEVNGQDTDMKLTLMGNTYHWPLKKHEIATLRIDEQQCMTRVNFLEKDI